MIGLIMMISDSNQDEDGNIEKDDHSTNDGNNDTDNDDNDNDNNLR